MAILAVSHYFKDPHSSNHTYWLGFFPEGKTADVGIDLQKFRDRVLGGAADVGSDKVTSNDFVSCKDEEDDDYDEDDDLYENDSVEMEDDERKEINMVDSLLEDENDLGKTENEVLLKENSPVLRMNFTPEEVENLRQRVKHTENAAL